MKPVTLAKFFGAKVVAGPGIALLGLAALLSLRFGLLPFWYDRLSSLSYWLMAAAASLGMIASLVLHDLAHVLAAKILGERPHDIRLLIFGGIETLEIKPRNRRTEWRIAFAGPLFSTALGMGTFLVAYYLDRRAYPLQVVGTLFHVGAANITLALFNLLPFYPLDGGRALRAWLWRRRKSFLKANRVATRGGLLAAFLLCLAGVLLVNNGNFITGGWLLAFGVVLAVAAKVAREGAELHTTLAKTPISRLMIAYPAARPLDSHPALASSASAAEAMERMIEDDLSELGVTEGGRLVGSVKPGLLWAYVVGDA